MHILILPVGKCSAASTKSIKKKKCRKYKIKIIICIQVSM